LALGLVVAQAAFGASAVGKPRVALDDVSPLTVVGSGFPAREAVVVTVQGKGIHLQKTVGSTAKGAFSARWNRSVVIGRCNNNAIVVTARAADGTRAVWKPVIVKPCPPPIEP
jgi:hypothetical protein